MRIRSDKRRLVMAAAAVALVATGCGGTDAGESAGGGIEPIELAVSATTGGPEGYDNRAIQKYLDAVEEASDGAITSKFYYANELVAPNEIGQAFQSGVVDMAHFITAYTADAFPGDAWLLELSESPFQSEPPAQWMEHAAAGYEWWWSEENADLRKSTFEDQGIYPLGAGFSTAPSYDLLCNDPITSLEDVKGKTVRTALPGHVAAAEDLGMKPVSMVVTEMYEAMQRGVVDCAMINVPTITAIDLWSVAKNWTEGGFVGSGTYCICLSLSTWEELSPEAQDIMWEQFPVFLEAITTETLTEYDKFFSEAEAEGVTLNEPSDELREAIQGHRADVIAGAVDNAPDVVEDPEAAAALYVDLRAEWATKIEDLGIEQGAWKDFEIDDLDVQPFVDLVAETVVEPRLNEN